MTTIKIDPNQREDLRKVYLGIHGSKIVTDIPDLASSLKLKRQYVKELVGVLETAEDSDGNPFVLINTQAGEDNNDTPHDWFQTFHTIDDHTEEDAEKFFDEHFPAEVKASAPRTPRNATNPTASNPAGLPLCMCGCGSPVNRGRNYKPGHDARHAGQVAREVAAGGPESLIGELPTDALRVKAADMVVRLKSKPAKKAASAKATEAPTKVEQIKGHVKKGRWSYDAEQNSVSGAVTYVDKQGKTQVADAKTAATFEEA